MPVTFEKLKKDEQVCAYIKAGNDGLKTLGFTEHSFPHVYHTANTAAELLIALGFSDQVAELARIAGLMHDIGNMTNRTLHALTGAEITRSVLERHGMDYDDIGIICSAIGNHDEGIGRPVNTVSAALILADKSDVRRSRVQETDMDKILADIHDRVNYAVKRADITAIRGETGAVVRLCLDIDNFFCPVMDYFEIFLTRMLMCRRAAAFLGAGFDLIINDLKIM
ncbi:MAG: HD domain-containing protein [Oscillospiraceae bacterium]|nr:HD domain-containing protein [Oscillospiraceae bacterium]